MASTAPAVPAAPPMPAAPTVIPPPLAELTHPEAALPPPPSDAAAQLPPTPRPAPAPASPNNVTGGADAAEQDPARKEFKHQIIVLVKKNAKTFLEDGVIKSAEEYKQIVRKLTHKILQKEHGKTVLDDVTHKKVAKYVSSFIEKRLMYKAMANSNE